MMPGFYPASFFIQYTYLFAFFTATVKIEVQHHPPLPPSLERSGKGGERGGGSPITGQSAIQNKKGDHRLPRINYFCIVNYV